MHMLPRGFTHRRVCKSLVTYGAQCNKEKPTNEYEKSQVKFKPAKHPKPKPNCFHNHADDGACQ